MISQVFGGVIFCRLSQSVYFWILDEPQYVGFSLILKINTDYRKLRWFSGNKPYFPNIETIMNTNRRRPLCPDTKNRSEVPSPFKFKS